VTPPEVRIVLNTNVKMSRHKAAAQAVHAALFAFGIQHGRVVVLGGRPADVEAMDTVIRDAGLTEVEPGTLTAGARVLGEVSYKQKLPRWMLITTLLCAVGGFAAFTSIILWGVR